MEISTKKKAEKLKGFGFIFIGEYFVKEISRFHYRVWIRATVANKYPERIHFS